MFLCFRHRLFSAVVARFYICIYFRFFFLFAVDSLKRFYLFFGGRLIELLVLARRAARVGNAL